MECTTKFTKREVVISIQYEGKVFGTFVNFPLRVSRVSSLEPAMSPTHGERLRVVGCGLKNKLVWLLSLGTGSTLSPYRNRHLMRCMTRRLAAGQVAAVRDIAAKEAEELCASGKCVAALVPLQRAIYLGDLPLRALMAWLLIDGREGVVQDRNGAFELVQEGARLGCHHCQGVMAECNRLGHGIRQDGRRSLVLARESSRKGSRYGQQVLGVLYQYGEGGVAQDINQALELYQLAAAQNFDQAQFRLGYMYYLGWGVAQDYAEALRLYQLAAAQGHPRALYWVAYYHEVGRGVPKNMAEAIRWYRCAQAAGHPEAANDLQRLRA